MKKLWTLAIAIAALSALASCYERKVIKLDYSEKMQSGVYSPTGLPGAAHVGRTEIEDKYHGYEAPEGGSSPGVKPPEKKPEEKAPEPEEKKLEDAFKG
ncbi:MAG: hypothetical protein JXR96_00980 [Deltaproteobacteria bacterium]|nr:hypothetical protein [Deltaproteobacteria bacterium]